MVWAASPTSAQPGPQTGSACASASGQAARSLTSRSGPTLLAQTAFSSASNSAWGMASKRSARSLGIDQTSA